jgi:hypothetical protein
VWDTDEAKHLLTTCARINMHDALNHESSTHRHSLARFNVKTLLNDSLEGGSRCNCVLQRVHSILCSKDVPPVCSVQHVVKVLICPAMHTKLGEDSTTLVKSRQDPP